MGLIRGGLFALVTIAFLLALLSFAILMTVSESLEYNQVQDNLGKFLIGEINGSLNLTGVFDESKPYLDEYCKNNTDFFLSPSQSIIPIDEKFPVSINLSCGSISSGEEMMLGEIINESFEQLYTEEYECELADCLDDEREAFYFFSEGFKEYVEGKYYSFLIAILVIFILMFLLSETKSNSFIVAGFLAVLISLPFMKFTYLFSFVDGYMRLIFDIFFSKSYFTFIRLFIAGFVLIAFGFALKFTNLGTKLSDWLDRSKKQDDQEKQKEEIKELKSEVSEIKKGNRKPKKKMLKIDSVNVLNFLF